MNSVFLICFFCAVFVYSLKWYLLWRIIDRDVKGFCAQNVCKEMSKKMPDYCYSTPLDCCVAHNVISEITFVF